MQQADRFDTCDAQPFVPMLVMAMLCSMQSVECALGLRMQ